MPRVRTRPPLGLPDPDLDAITDQGERLYCEMHLEDLDGAPAIVDLRARWAAFTQGKPERQAQYRGLAKLIRRQAIEECINAAETLPANTTRPAVVAALRALVTP